MNAARLQEQSFAEGLERQLVKSALNPRIAEQIHIDPRRMREFLGEGATIFAKSHKSTNPFAGLLATGFAGYGQLRDTHALRDNFLKTVSALRESASMHPAGSSARGNIEDTIRRQLLAFRAARDQKLTEIGSTALGRKQMLRNAGTAVGVGAGAAGGVAVGTQMGQNSAQNDVAGAPLSSRLQYLFNPSKLPSAANSAMPGPADMSDQTQ